MAVVEPLPQPQPKPIVEDNTQEFAVDEGDMPTEEETVFNVVETQPEFPGGTKALMNYLMENIQYPTISHNNNSQGRVLVRFVVREKGDVSDIEVFKGSGDYYLDKEAVRVVSKMPRWIPGRHGGKTVSVYFVLPVVFRLT